MLNKKTKQGESMRKLRVGDVVECVKNPKEFYGQAQITTVCSTPKDYLWVDWYYGFGMIKVSDVKLSKAQSKIIYSKERA